MKKASKKERKRGVGSTPESKTLDQALGIIECLDCGRRPTDKPIDMPFYEIYAEKVVLAGYLCEECYYFRYKDGR